MSVKMNIQETIINLDTTEQVIKETLEAPDMEQLMRSFFDRIMVIRYSTTRYLKIQDVELESKYIDWMRGIPA